LYRTNVADSYFLVVLWRVYMVEVILFLTLAFVAYIFMSDKVSNPFKKSGTDFSSIVVPEDSTLRRHFLTHLSTENALVAAEIQKRLSK